MMFFVRFDFIAFFSLLLLGEFLTHIEAFKQCANNNNCINLGSCGCELSRVINAEKKLTDDQAYELAQNVCGLDLNSPFEFKIKVCCECLGADVSTPVPSLIEKLENLPPRVSLKLGPKKCNNYIHKNMDVLPKDCGLSESYEELIRPRIINGNKTAHYKLPWMVRIMKRNKEENTLTFICGGTLISKLYVLTAAHCINKPPPLYLVFGLTDVTEDYKDDEYEFSIDEEQEDEQIVSDIQKIPEHDRFIHPKFNPRTNENDIALLRLDTEVKYSISTRPICLPVNKRYCKDLEKAKLIVSGWGRTETGNISNQLLHTEVPFVPNQECENIFRKSLKVYKNNICAGGGFTDACFGDSGGPLQMVIPHGNEGLSVQYGIVSQGFRSECSKPGYPGIYTSVKHFLTWIIDTMEIHY